MLKRNQAGELKRDLVGQDIVDAGGSVERSKHWKAHVLYRGLGQQACELKSEVFGTEGEIDTRYIKLPVRAEKIIAAKLRGYNVAREGRRSRSGICSSCQCKDQGGGENHFQANGE